MKALLLAILRVSRFLNEGVVGNLPSLRKSYDLFFSSAMLAFVIVACFESAFVTVVNVVDLGMSMVVVFLQLPEALRELVRDDLDEAIVDAIVAFVLTLPSGDVGVLSQASCIMVSLVSSSMLFTVVSSCVVELSWLLSLSVVGCSLMDVFRGSCLSISAVLPDAELCTLIGVDSTDSTDSKSDS